MYVNSETEGISDLKEGINATKARKIAARFYTLSAKFLFWKKVARRKNTRTKIGITPTKISLPGSLYIPSLKIISEEYWKY